MIEPSTAQIQHVTNSGTLTLNANGSFTISGTSGGLAIDVTSGYDQLQGNPPVVTSSHHATVTENASLTSSNNGPFNFSGMWALSGNSLTLTFPTFSQTYTAAGGRLFVYSGFRQNPNSTDAIGSGDAIMSLLIRTN